MIRVFVAILLLSITQVSLAAADVGHVVWVRGSFAASGRVLQRLSPIYVSDVLSTGSGSQAEIAFTDGTLMTFKENSKYSVDSYRFKKAMSGNFAGTLMRGGYRTITGLVAKQNPDNYIVQTPVATIGVRGTDYEAVYTGGYLYVEAFSGTVCITPYNNSNPSAVICPTGLVGVLAD